MLPLAVALRLHALEPHVLVVGGRLVRHARLVEIAADRDGDVAVSFHLHVVQVPVSIGGRLPLDPLDPRGLRVHLQRRAAVQRAETKD